MATKPTRMQDRACDLLADVLVKVAEAARLDGGTRFGAGDLAEVAARLARASTAFDLDAIVARALETRGRALGLRAGTAELLTLMDGAGSPLEALRLADDAFRERIAALEAELGEV